MSDPRVAPASARFGDAADLYDRARPGYPEELLDVLAQRTGLGPGCVVADVAAGRVDVMKVPPAALPAPLQAMSEEARVAYIEEQAGKRTELKKQIAELSAKREAYLA